jgi:hypothetical protein
MHGQQQQQQLNSKTMNAMMEMLQNLITVTSQCLLQYQNAMSITDAAN